MVYFPILLYLVYKRLLLICLYQQLSYYSCFSEGGNSMYRSSQKMLSISTCVLCASMLFGCSKGTETTNTTASTTTPAATSAATAAAKETKAPDAAKPSPSHIETMVLVKTERFSNGSKMWLPAIQTKMSSSSRRRSRLLRATTSQKLRLPSNPKTQHRISLQKTLSC